MVTIVTMVTIVSDEVAKFLLGSGIDKDIVNLPQKVISSPMGPLFKSHLEKMSNVAPTDSRQYRQVVKENGNHGNHSHHGNGHVMTPQHHVTRNQNGATVLFTPEFSDIPLDTDDVAILQEVDPLLPTAITHGPLSAEDLPLLVALETVNARVFARVMALLAHKSGFIRLLLGDTSLFQTVRRSLSTERPHLLNNVVAGLNQAERHSAPIISDVMGIVTGVILESQTLDFDVIFARISYNLSGCTLNDDQVIELGSALLFALPDNLTTQTSSTVIPSHDQNSDIPEDPPKNKQPVIKPEISTETTNKLKFIMKALFLLMSKNREVVDLCSAMDKNFEIFSVYPDLEQISLNIIQLQEK